MAKGKSNNMDSLFGGFTAPNLNLNTPVKDEPKAITEDKAEKQSDEKPVAIEPATVKKKETSSPKEKKATNNSTAKESETSNVRADVEERGVSLRLAEEIDETYLDVVSIQNDISKKQFLANIMTEAVEEARSIKPKDIDYNEPFRKDVKLKCKQVTILLPAKLYDDINQMAKKYGMATARYIAWSVQKARLKDPDWN